MGPVTRDPRINTLCETAQADVSFFSIKLFKFVLMVAPKRVLVSARTEETVVGFRWYGFHTRAHRILITG